MVMRMMMMVMVIDRIGGLDPVLHISGEIGWTRSRSYAGHAHWCHGLVDGQGSAGIGHPVHAHAVSPAAVRLTLLGQR